MAIALSAQEKGAPSIRIEPGVLLNTTSDNLGLLLNAEPKIRISKKTVIGMRFGLALNSQKFESAEASRFIFNTESDHAVISFTPTFDYYLNDEKARPYLGMGVGYFIVSEVDIISAPIDIAEGNVNNQIGVLLRGGFDIGKTRLGLEYNYIPKADITIPDGQVIGTVKSGYIGLSIGFTLGNGKNAA
ncbi:MAG: hypothetical protein KTR22_03360 [Flavobacteriaceae bacterium]|nr:hypothetical protein [Flavobacteriaceae bacterium]